MVVSVIAVLLWVRSRVGGSSPTSSCRKTPSRFNCLSPECKHDVVVRLGANTALCLEAVMLKLAPQ